MIRIIAAAARHHEEIEWLSTYWLFSFSDYYDPENVHFALLRVFNDDVIAPQAGFPLHGHQEMEIITIPLSGELTHEDNAGHRAVVRAGDVQRMSAGTGIRHAEMNLGSEPAHLYQIWFFPTQPGIVPDYAQRAFAPVAWQNRLLPLVSGHSLPDTLTMNADATLYRAALDSGTVIDFTPRGRNVFIYLTSGAVIVNDATLSAGDQARITGEAVLRLTAVEGAEMMLIDMA